MRGRVLAYDGRPLALAHARITVPGSDDVTVEVGPDGTFELTSRHRGLAWLEVSGVAHRPLKLAVWLDPQPQALEVRMGTNGYRDDFDELRLRLSRGGRERFFRAQPRADGRYEVVVENIEGPAELSWTSALTGCCGETAAGRVGQPLDRSGWTADGAGQYRWVEEFSGRPSRVIFDPSALPPPNRPPDIRFREDDGLLARVAGIEAEASAIQRAYHQAVLAQAALPSGGAQRIALEFPWAKHAERLGARAETEPDPRIRGVAWAAYFDRPASSDPTDAERARAAQALHDIAPDDALWSWGRVATALRATGDTQQARDYAAQVVAGHRDADVVSDVLWLRVIGWGVNNEGQAAAKLALAAPRFANSSGQQRLLQLETRDQQLRELPDFVLAPLDASHARISSEDLRGKTYLLSFWATWCEPCVEEMPQLHRLQERFEDHGLRIVSVAVDNLPPDVSAFRDGRWPMPWQHARLDAVDRPTLWTQLGLAAHMPAAVLVDEQGRIVAAGASPVVFAAAARMLSGGNDRAWDSGLDLGGLPPERAAEILQHVRALEALGAAQQAEAGPAP